jgi:hypothetical protein
MRKQRVLFADKVVQETTLGANIKNWLVLEGGRGYRTIADNEYYVSVQGGALETTPAEEQSYIDSVIPPINTPTATVPNPPTSLAAATITTTSIVVSFTPGTDGGSPITNYEYSIDGGSIFTAFSPVQALSPITITGLSSNTSYTIKLKAVNTIGASIASSSLSVTTASVPGAPTIVFSSSGNTLVYVYFTLGTNSSSVTNYTYSTDGGSNFTPFSPAISTSPVTITGLTNGTPYDIVLKAISGDLTSDASNTFSVSSVDPSTSAPLINYDPSNINSYSGSGTSITNIGSLGAFIGTLRGSVVYSSDNSGILDFNGTNGSYITCPTINLGNTISVCAWVYPRRQNTICGLFTNAAANTQTNGFKFQWNFWQRNPDSLNIGLEAGNGSTGGNSYTPDNVVTLNAWQHLGYVYDQVNRRIVFFLNGVPTTVLQTSVVANVNTNALVNVGGYSGGFFTMNAKLGYIHIFNTLLNATEIYDDFNASKTRFGF